jgi:hypothetical protein
LPFGVSPDKVVKVLEDIGIKNFKYGPFREINLYRGQIFVEKWMRFFGFRSPIWPSLLKLCEKCPRGEIEGIFLWVLPMAEVRKFFLGRLLENLENWKNRT